MSATCLKPKNFIKTEAWSDIFSTFNTESQSCLFMKQLTTTCVSTILHLRKIFPDDYFEFKNVAGISLKLLKSGKEHIYGNKVHKWLQGAFDAIDKKYLKHLMLDIKDGDSKMTLEIYTMTFNYQKGSEALNILLSNEARNRSKNNLSPLAVSNIQLRTMKLLQMCDAVTKSCSSLPSQVTLAIRLSYHEDTPPDYQPIGYKAWEPTASVFPKATRSIEIGVTGTNHHSFKLVNKSCLNEQFFRKLDDFRNENNAKSEVHFDKSSIIPKMNLMPTRKDEKVRCPCLSTEKSEMMFLCFRCKHLVHSECFGILLSNTFKKFKFYCHLCHDPEMGFKCHDKVMMNLKSAKDQQKLALLRRILKFCNAPQVTKITQIKMEKIASANCSKDVTEIVLKKMIKIGVVIPQKKKKNYLIDKNNLCKEQIHYFYKFPSSVVATEAKEEPMIITPQEAVKRKVLDLVDIYANKKCKISSNPAEEFTPQQSFDSISQHSKDIFC